MSGKSDAHRATFQRPSAPSKATQPGPSSGLMRVMTLPDLVHTEGVLRWEVQAATVK
jgi:hypothetical protein